jgi:succinate dehydrogenase/fumarate reductase cytochrome b subunit
MTTTTSADSGAGADAVHDVADEADIEPVPVPPRPRNRAGVLCGVVVFVYALFLAVEVIVAGFDHRLYNRLHQVQGNVFARAVLAVVVGCALFHGLNGLRLMVADLPALTRMQPTLRALVAFATFALGIPAAAVILWPSISELFR